MWYKEYIKDANNPDWNGKHSRCHNWRYYVTDEVRSHWAIISLIGRCAIISCCTKMADNEIWD